MLTQGDKQELLIVGTTGHATITQRRANQFAKRLGHKLIAESRLFQPDHIIRCQFTRRHVAAILRPHTMVRRQPHAIACPSL